MGIKLTNNNNSVGAGLLLLLVLLLSQSKALDFMMNTALGRIVMIVLILAISYIHKTLGVISVLLIIIMVNNIGFMEGFDSETKDDTEKVKVKEKEKGKEKEPVKEENVSANLSRSIDDIKNELAKAVAATSAKEPDTEPVIKSEGFDVLGTERDLQKGKCSNSIGTNPLQNCDMISPVEGNMFSNFFSVFE